MKNRENSERPRTEGKWPSADAGRRLDPGAREIIHPTVKEALAGNREIRRLRAAPILGGLALPGNERQSTLSRTHSFPGNQNEDARTPGIGTGGLATLQLAKGPA
jgi:hypothetical protein